ncbi:MAG: L-seryl-tRNA(Sec) selenium transferase [bacterium]
MLQASFRHLPSLQEADHLVEERGLLHGKPAYALIRRVLEEMREDLRAGQLALPSREEARDLFIQRFSSQLSPPPSPVLNLTGVVIHTNLGRSALPESLLGPLLNQWCRYTPLEFDLESGKRGKRDQRLRQLLRDLSGAEEALAVNNNAAAVFLMLRALAQEGEVLVSRGELVEIGGSFRVPDIMREAGCTLVEVGTTNRTRLADYAQAITERTVAILKVHPSNYALVGFTEDTPLSELAALAEEYQLWSLYDWGSGSFYRFQQPGLHAYPTVRQVLDSGVDVLAFSGDKLLGTVQAGLVLGRQAALERMRRHPLYRALRLDKVTLSILETLLAVYWDPAEEASVLPTVALLERTLEDLQPQVEEVLQQLSVPLGSGWDVKAVGLTSLTGGGALPDLNLPSWGLKVSHPEWSAQKIQEALREGSPAVIVRVAEEAVLLDFRTLLPGEAPELVGRLQDLFGRLDR